MSALRASGSNAGSPPRSPRVRASVSTAVLSPEKRDVEVAGVEHRPRQRDGARPARFGKCGERRTARIGQAEQVRRLVERLAGGVVERVAEQPIAADAGDLEELRVAARHEQRHERERGAGVPSIGDSRWPSR